VLLIKTLDIFNHQHFQRVELGSQKNGDVANENHHREKSGIWNQTFKSKIHSITWLSMPTKSQVFLVIPKSS
jgi:hypothetical protein